MRVPNDARTYFSTAFEMAHGFRFRALKFGFARPVLGLAGVEFIAWELLSSLQQQVLDGKVEVE
jgi:hypothetical protein